MRFISKKQVKDLIGLGFTQIDRLEAEDKLPKRIRLTEGRVVWIEEQILEWMRQRVAAREPIILLREKEKAAAKARAEAKSKTGGDQGSGAAHPPIRFLSKKEVCDLTRLEIERPADEDQPTSFKKAA